MELPPQADAIIVIAPRLAEAPGEQAFSSFPIDQTALEDVIRVDEALRAAPGVSLFRRNDSAAANPTIQGLSLRGAAPSGAGRVLVLLDGQPLNDPFGGWVIWGALSPETLSRANIVRGAGAGPYGAGALLGAVRLDERDRDGFAWTIEGGDRGHWRGSGFGLASDAAFSLLLGVQAQHEDGWIPVRSARGAADAPVWFEGASAVARLGWRGEDLNLSVRLAGYDEERGAGLVGAQSKNAGRSLSIALARPNGPLAWRLQAWAMDSDLANSSVAVAPDRSATTPANDQLETPAHGSGMNAALRWSGERGGVELGADLRAADGRSSELFRFQGGQFTRSRSAGGESLIAGAYLEAWRQAGPYLLAGGARLDHWRAFAASRVERDISSGAATLALRPRDNDALAPTARLGARRALAGDHFLRAAVYAGFRPPTLNELHRPFRVGNDVTEANPALEPERLVGGDVALGRESEALHWSFAVFATQLQDAVVNVTLGAGPGAFPPGVFVPAGGVFRQRRNAGDIDAFGVEAEARGERGALAWHGALTYVDARFGGAALGGLRPAQSPQWSATAGFSWRAASGATLSADVSYESARFEDDQNVRELSPATVLDLRVDQRLGDTLTFFAALNNALDEAIETAETADGVASFGPPRALRLGLRVAT